MSFWSSLVGSAPAPAAAPAPTPAPAPAAPGATAPAPQPAPAPAPEGLTGLQPAPQAPSGLDFFARLVQNNGAGSNATAAPTFSIPQETLQQASSQLDFTQGIPPEAVQRLQGGDWTALTEILNHVGRTGYQAAMTHSMALTNRFVDDRLQHEAGTLDQRIGHRLATSNLPSIAELNPIAQTMFRDTMTHLQTAYPGASQAQLEQQAWTLMEDLGKQFDRTGRQQQQQQRAAEPDWDAYGGFTQPK